MKLSCGPRSSAVKVELSTSSDGAFSHKSFAPSVFKLTDDGGEGRMKGKNSIIKLFCCITDNSQRMFVKINVAFLQAAGGHKSLVN